MSIKLFASGLGLITQPLAAADRTSTNKVGDVVVKVDHLAQSGQLKDVSVLSPIANNLFIHNGAIATQILSVSGEQTLSQESQVAPFDTLFNGFDLETFVHYNFWVEDERTNDREPRGNRKVEDIPRYVRVVWNPAPNLPGLNDVLPREKFARAPRSTKFAGGVETSQFHGLNGIVFTPEHLNPENFSLVCSSLANGHLGPAILETTVELPSEHMTVMTKAPQVDEDAFLLDSQMKGLAINELNAQLSSLNSTMAGSSLFESQAVSAGAQGDKNKLVTGKFGVSYPKSSGGTMNLQSVQPSSPAISMKASAIQSAPGSKGDRVMDLAEQSSLKPSEAGSHYTKVNFVQPTIGGLLDQKKVNMMSRPEHAESLVAVAQVLPQLEALYQSGIQFRPRKGGVPSFPSPIGLKPLEYVGYVLEKYRRTKQGAFEKIDEIQLPSREYTEYYDTKILYGEVYRYRIRAIIRWTHHSDVSVNGRETLKNSLGNQNVISKFRSSYFGTEWSPKWGYANIIDTVPPPHPDELIVRPDSARKRILVSFRLPHNPQRDIVKMQLFRKLQDENGKDLSGWKMVCESGPRNVLYVDTDVDFVQRSGVRYVYTAQTKTRHSESSNFCEQLGATLNEDHVVYGENAVKFISCAGVSPEHFGSFSVYPFKRIDGEVVYPVTTERKEVSIGVKGREATGSSQLSKKTYYLRVESLDTGEYRDHTVVVDYDNLPPKNLQVPYGAVVFIAEKYQAPPIIKIKNAAVQQAIAAVSYNSVPGDVKKKG